MKCPNCGFEAQSNFCPTCGTPLQQNPYPTPVNPQPPQNTYPQPAAAPPQQNPYQPTAGAVPPAAGNQPAAPLPKKSPAGWIIAASVIGSVVLTGIVIAIISATVFRGSVFDMDQQDVKPTVDNRYDDDKDDDDVSTSIILEKGEPHESDYGTITLQSVTYGADTALGNEGSYLRCNIEIKNSTNKEITHQYIDTVCSNTKYFYEDYYYSLNGEKRDDLYATLTLKPGDTAILTLLCHCPDGKLPSSDLILTTKLGNHDLSEAVELILMISPEDIQQDTPESATESTTAPTR